LGSGNLKFGLDLSGVDFEDLPRVAKSVEEAGFDSIWSSDHIVSANLNREYLNTWPRLTAYAMATKKVRLGTIVTDPCRMHPAVLAQMIGTIDRISNGRFILGMGAGEIMNLKPYGIPYDHRVERLRESLQVMKGLWMQEFFSYQGRYFHLSSAHIQAFPVQKPHPTTFVSALSPKSMRVMASEADGWLSLASSPKMVKQNLAKIREICGRINRNMSALEVVFFTEFAVAEDYEEAENAVKGSARRTLAVWPKNLERLGYQARDEYDYSRMIPDESSESQIREFAESIPIELVRDTAIYGTSQDCINKIREYCEVGVTYLILRPANVEKQLRPFKQEIKPSFTR